MEIGRVFLGFECGLRALQCTCCCCCCCSPKSVPLSALDRSGAIAFHGLSISLATGDAVPSMAANVVCPGEVLKAVFPLLNGLDLASCMCVCRQWRLAASDDYLWKLQCARRWPSTRKSPGRHPIGAAVGYYKLFTSLYRKQRLRALPASSLSFDALEFYVDIWLDSKSVYSDVVAGPVVQLGILDPPLGICESMRNHLKSSTYKMTIPVCPRFEVSFTEMIHVSLLVRRRDKDQVACIIDKSGFNYVDGPGYKAHAYDYLQFSPQHPFVSEIRAWLALLFIDAKGGRMEVFGIELDFCDVANSDNEVLWLLDILDWK